MPSPFVPSTEEQVRKAIDTIRSMDLSNRSIEDVNEQLTVLLTGHQMFAPIFNPPISLHRARKINRLPNSLKEIGAPPAEKVRCDQRCNRAGQSLFYCSAARNAPFFEVHAEVGDHIVLSEWCTTVNMTVNHVGYTHSNFARLQSNRHCPNWSNATPAFQPTERTRLVDELFSSLFSIDVRDGDEHLYKASIAITEKLIPEPTEPDAFRLDGLMYPTIPMSANCENFALKPGFVARGVKFVKAEYLRIREIDGMTMTFDRIDFANSVSGDDTLLWKGRPGHWVLRPKAERVQLRVNEQGEWEVRNMDGELVPME